MDNWICIYTTNQLNQAEMMKNYLIEENIEAVVMNKKDSAYTVFNDVELYVPSEDENLAAELIKSFKF